MPHTRFKVIRKPRRGQGLVEYALILALVALVAILALGLIGLATSRGYGVVAGALGAKKGDDPAHGDGWYLYFERDQLPRCGNYSGKTLLYGSFHTNIDPQYLSVSTEAGFISENIIQNTGGGTTDFFDVNYQVAKDPPDNTKCPRSIVVQSDKAHGGLTILYPVEIKDWS